MARTWPQFSVQASTKECSGSEYMKMSVYFNEKMDSYKKASYKQGEA